MRTVREGSEVDQKGCKRDSRLACSLWRSDDSVFAGFWFSDGRGDVTG